MTKYPIIVRNADRFVAAILPNGMAIRPARVPYHDPDRDGEASGFHYGIEVLAKGGESLGVGDIRGSLENIIAEIERLASELSKDCEGV